MMPVHTRDRFPSPLPPKDLPDLRDVIVSIRSFVLFSRRAISQHLGLLSLYLIFAPGVASGETVEGFAEPFKTIEVVGAVEPGLIVSIGVKEGEVVEPGKVLASLENGVLEASLRIAHRRSQMRGRLEAALAELRMRGDRAEKLRQLRAQGHASAAELERAETDRAVAQAQVMLAEEEIELAALECQRIQAQIEQRIFRSPIQGVVAKIHREEGESLLINDPALMTLVQLDPLRVTFPVSSRSAGELKPGAKFPIEVPEIEATMTGTIERVSPVMDAKSGTVEIHFLVDNLDRGMRSGMRCLLRVGKESDDKPKKSPVSNPEEASPTDGEW